MTEINLQLHHVVSDITGATGMRIIRAIIAGERDPAVLASMRDTRCHSSAEMIEQALTGHYRGEHLFVLEQALALYDVYQQKVAACDIRIESVLKELSSIRGRKEDARADGSGSPRRRSRQSNGPDFDVGKALHSLLGKDLTRIHGMGPYLALKLVSECGDDLSAWPSAKHFTSWLCLAPSNKISGGKVLSSRTRRSGSRAASLLRLAAVTIGRTDTALGAFYRRLSARAGKSKAVTATARKIATLFYNALRHGMDYVDPGASYYETRYRERVVRNLHRRAKAFEFILQAAEMPAAELAAPSRKLRRCWAPQRRATAGLDERRGGSGARQRLDRRRRTALGLSRGRPGGADRPSARQPLAAVPAAAESPKRAGQRKSAKSYSTCCREPRFVDLAPAEVYASLLDQGVYLCSIRTMYRVLAEHDEVRRTASTIAASRLSEA